MNGSRVALFVYLRRTYAFNDIVPDKLRGVRSTYMVFLPKMTKILIRFVGWPGRVLSSIRRRARTLWRKMRNRCVMCGVCIEEPRPYPGDQYHRYPMYHACRWCNKRYFWASNYGASADAIRRIVARDRLSDPISDFHGSNGGNPPTIH